MHSFKFNSKLLVMKFATVEHLSSQPIKLIYFVQEFLFIFKCYYQSLSCSYFCKYVSITYPTLKYSHEKERKINQSCWCQANSWLTEFLSIHPDVKL